MAKLVGRLVIFAVLAVLLYFVARMGFRFIAGHWRGILFWGYVAVGVVSGIGILVFQLRLQEGKVGYYSVIVAAQEHARKPSNPFVRVVESSRKALVSILMFLMSVCGWLPFVLGSSRSIVHGAKGGGNYSLIGMARTALHPPDPAIAAFTLVAVLLAGACCFVFPQPGGTYGYYFVVLLLLATATRQAIYVLDKSSIGQRLRRSLSSPYPAFVRLSICDFLVLLGGFLLLRVWADPSAASGIPIKQVALAIANPAGWTTLLDTSAMFSLEWCTQLSGLVFSGAVLSTALRVWAFKRTDEDYVALGMAHLLMGEFNEALGWLKRVDKDRSASFRQAQALALLGVGEVDKALVEARQWCDQQVSGPAESKLSDNGVLGRLLASAALLPIPKAILMDIISRAADSHVPPAWIASALAGVLGGGRLTPDDLREIVNQGKVAVEYPLVRIQVLMDTGERSQAQELMNAYVPSTAQEVAWKSLLVPMLIVSDPKSTPQQDQGSFREWAEKEIPLVKKAISELGSDEERGVVAGLLNSVEAIARTLGKDYVEQLRYVKNSVEANIEGADFVGNLILRDMRSALSKIYVRRRG